jgi:glycosyltransferase involved in cell wall biosynthesis
MNIAFDAKRAFHNNTGLGNYSRTFISALAQYYPAHQYFMFNPKRALQFSKPDFPNVHEKLPEDFLSKQLPSFWRSHWVTKDLLHNKIDLYHGLSNEIPLNISKIGVPSAVTVHDLIFERFRGQYNRVDVAIYRNKYKYACRYANTIIAISEQTKQDLIEFYKVEAGKIEVCYQSCDPLFSKNFSALEITNAKLKYDLPTEYFLYVGSIIERKNLLKICYALHSLKGKMDIPLVVIGRGGAYLEKVKKFITDKNMMAQVIFLSEALSFNKATKAEMASIYQGAIAMIYPSFFEGFGIPILEALWSRLPVITSNVSCLPETGGSAAFYVNPSNSDEIANAMYQIKNDEGLRMTMINEGLKHAQNFTMEKCCAQVMSVYEKIKNA